MPTRFLVCVLVLSWSGVARAGGDDCDAELRTYYKPDKLPDKVTTRCTIKDGKCTSVELKGYLFQPPLKVTQAKTVTVATTGSVPPILLSSGRPPLFLFNHGSEPLPGKKCDIGTYFSKLGFVVFVPHRRGQGKSTGADFATYTKDFCSTPGQDGPCKMEYLHKQVDDVEEAIHYVESLKDSSGKPLVDANRIVIAGHSFGGITTVFANTKDMGQKVVIDGAGASQSWEGNESARSEMKAAVKAAVAPIYFFEPMNDHSIDATIELSKTAGQACRQYQATLFPAVDADGDGKITKKDYSGDWDGDGTTYDPRDKAHGTFMGKTDVWGPSAIEFINRYFQTPAQPFDTLCQGTSSQP